MRGVVGCPTSAANRESSLSTYRLDTLPTTVKTEWTRRDLNPGPLPCQGSDLPLIYEPDELGFQRCGNKPLDYRRPKQKRFTVLPVEHPIRNDTTANLTRYSPW